MDDQPRPALVAALVDAVDARSDHQTDWIIRSLVRRSWPGGTTDRYDPMAARWVRLWGPARMQPYQDDCSCDDDDGRCAVCN